ncbi:MAG: hypothetical protein FJ386_09990, partial [Verrucomicrobia bacterium]|nr:hypothetical protein [Verrucomicrobiota bacterium]
MNAFPLPWLLVVFSVGFLPGPMPCCAAEKPFHTAELIFPLEHWHNHGSCIVEAPNGDLIV